jgi:transcription initiation factor IIE alpha subunit
LHSELQLTPPTSFVNPSIMARGRKICADVQQIVVQLSSLLSREDIAAYTSISITSVNRILLYFEQHGAIDDEPKERHKRAKLLRDEDVNVSLHIFFTL